MRGVYCLILHVVKNVRIKVGALGLIKFKRGIYVYVGSAQNGIDNRIKRHLKKVKRRYWHIDYLVANKYVRIEKVVYKEAPKDEECRIASFLNLFCEPVKGFGCSDCKCISHLFWLKKWDSDFISRIGQELK